MLTAKAERILKKGKSLMVGFFNPTNFQGRIYIAVYRGKIWKIIDDGTGNGYWYKGEPEEIEKETAIKLALNFYGIEEGTKKLEEVFNWKLTDEEINEALEVI